MSEEARQRQEAVERQGNAAEFLGARRIMDDVFILYSCLAPEVTLMSEMLEMAGGAWHCKQLQRMLELGERTFPLDMLRKENGCLDRMMQACLDKLLNPIGFEHVHQSEQCATRILATTLRLGATVYELCYVPLQKFPYKLFDVLQSEEAAQLCAAAPACCMDEWTASLLELYRTPQALASDEFKAVLSMLQEHLDMNTYSTKDSTVPAFGDGRLEHKPSLQTSRSSQCGGKAKEPHIGVQS